MECNRTLVVLIVMAFTAAIGVLLLFIACAVQYPGEDPGALGYNWWGLFMLLLYLLSPIPLAVARFFKSQDVISSESLSILYDVCYFISSCIVVSGFGLPFVLARQNVIQPVAGGIIGAANIFAFGTVYSYFIFFGREDDNDWNYSSSF